MFLKSLTLRGFKSFADKTVLEFEPGVTVVVGPNGSGKSNLVDAVAWVLGAQGPRTLRGGKMDDVIFAGTPDRPALGRAEVSLCIDNTAGLLPIEFSEVTITRTLFRAGDSEYQINGAPCRLLDIQELLSDSGIGRQQHVIVGSGSARRGAQLRVLKTERRGRRGSRRDPQVPQAWLERRRAPARGHRGQPAAAQRPVARGAPTAHAACTATRPMPRFVTAGWSRSCEAIRLHLAGHEIAGLQAKGERLRDQGSDLNQREGAVRMRLRDLDVSVLDAEQALTAAGHGDLADALTRIEALRARVAGFDALLGEKTRGLQRELLSVADEGVFETLVADAAELRRQLDELGALRSGLQEERAAIERGEYDLAAAQRAFAESAVPERNADDLRMARRDLETRREALARIDAELTRAAARLEQSKHAASPRWRPSTTTSRRRTRASPLRCPSSVRPPKRRGTRWRGCARLAAPPTALRGPPTPT